MKPLNNSDSLLTINTGEVHVWFAFPMDIKDPDLLERYFDLMNDEEKEKQKRYYFKEDRHNCLITRALVRSVLSRYAEKGPNEWTFSKNKHGKPEIKYSCDGYPLRFNLSHTDGLVACVVTLENDIGIDVENIKNRNINLKVADRFFSQLEVHDLQALPEKQRRKRFLDYWTLKESYIKARGKGLSIPLDKFSFILKKDLPTGILFDARMNDDEEDWRFFQITPSKMHKAAVAIRKNHIAEFKVLIRTAVTLLNERWFSCEVN